MVKTFEWYPADNVSRNGRTKVQKAPKVRSSITAGRVLILLSGRYRGKRVVFLKALKSGLLLVTGPHKVNGVPIKRVNQAYCIATSSSVDVSKVDCSKISDETFKRHRVCDGYKNCSKFEKAAACPKIDADRKAAQKSVDAAIAASMAATAKKPECAFMKQYLRARFSLTKNDKPHAMKF